jgi:hypothetical protein
MVAAVFDAFLQIYKRRTADLLRLATGGTGVLPDGAISTDLVNRLAREASKVAGQILNIAYAHWTTARRWTSSSASICEP